MGRDAQRSWTPTALAAASATLQPASPSDRPVDAIKKGGGGGGKPPLPPEWQARVMAYRVALLVCLVSWMTVYTLDFFMTTGIDIIDGSIQAAGLQVADLAAALAAMLVPVGSADLAGFLLRAAGSFTTLVFFLGGAALGPLASLGGPLCLTLIYAREIYWFGVSYKLGLVFGIAAQAFVLFQRFTTVLQHEGLARDMQLQEGPVGPPLPLSFVCTATLFVLAASKVLEPLGEDMEEEGEAWGKTYSRPLYETPEEGEEADDQTAAESRRELRTADRASERE